MTDVFSRIIDAVDVETFIVCKDEQEGKRLSRELMKKMGFNDTDIVFLEIKGPGARVRLRGYIHRPGVRYGWLSGDENNEK